MAKYPIGGWNRWTEESFLKQAVEKHGDKFSYENMKFVNAIEKVVVTCAIHGDILVSPQYFLKSDYGCQKCGYSTRGINIRLKHEEFLERAVKKHNGKYDYKDVVFNTTEDKVLIHCNCGNSFYQDVGGHLQGQGCTPCNLAKQAQRQSLTTEQFVERGKKQFGEKYDYSQVKYVNNHTNIEIKCNIHECTFWQLPSNHLKPGSWGGCPECRYITTLATANKSGGWSRTDWIKLQKGRFAQLYVYKIKSDSFEFIKIGITFQDINKRLRRMLKVLGKGVTVERIKVIESLDAGKIYIMEKKSKTALKNFRFVHDAKFNGRTECYQITPEVLSYINNL